MYFSAFIIPAFTSSHIRLIHEGLWYHLFFRFLHDRDRAPEATAHMKKVLVHLKNLPLKRKLAIELGLTDVLQTLSPHLDEGFLNDVARLWTGKYT